VGNWALSQERTVLSKNVLYNIFKLIIRLSNVCKLTAKLRLFTNSKTIHNKFNDFPRLSRTEIVLQASRMSVLHSRMNSKP